MGTSQLQTTSLLLATVATTLVQAAKLLTTNPLLTPTVMYRNYYFFQSTISLWNTLPDSVTGTHSVLLFKRALLSYL